MTRPTPPSSRSEASFGYGSVHWPALDHMRYTLLRSKWFPLRSFSTSCCSGSDKDLAYDSRTDGSQHGPREMRVLRVSSSHPTFQSCLLTGCRHSCETSFRDLDHLTHEVFKHPSWSAFEAPVKGCKVPPFAKPEREFNSQVKWLSP